MVSDFEIRGGGGGDDLEPPCLHFFTRSWMLINFQAISKESMETPHTKFFIKVLKSEDYMAALLDFYHKGL